MSALNRAIAEARHLAHSVYSRFRPPSQSRRSAAEQELLVSDTSFHRCSIASRSTAGNHWAACESPKSTTVVGEAGSP